MCLVFCLKIKTGAKIMSQITKLNFQQAKHITERSGLGPELGVIESFVGMSLDAVVDSLLAMPTENHIQEPALLIPSELLKVKKQYRDNGQRQKATKLYREERDIFKAWALQNLLESTNPLHERMVWFWHNHFTSSIKNVRTAYWMKQQDSSIRVNALGNFANLLEEMTFDPAMLIYLDGRSNKKGQPNENFARELLELFTLGEGHYSEQDIKEAARAFTGWRVNTKKNKVVFNKKHHDFGPKTFMGKKGNFTANDILSILLGNPRTSEFIAEKLWYEFVSAQAAEPKTIQSWATVLRSSNYDISKLLKTIFKSSAFWDKKYQGTLIKSPIDLVAGTLRTLDLEDIDTQPKVFLQQLNQMGQDLYAPPNVKGWVGGKAWIDDDSLLRRQRFLRRVLRGQAGAAKNKNTNMMNNGMKNKMSSNSMSSKSMSSNSMKKSSNYELPDLSAQQWSDWLLAIPAILPINKKTKQARLAAILLDPAYQLK